MSEASSVFHSVKLDPDKCVGCTTCIKKCPTEAIRVRKGKARIDEERCIDCGECIRTCPHGAKKAISDSLALLKNFRFKVAVPAPALYGQFDETVSVDKVLAALLALGFDDVFEVAEAAELVTLETRRILRNPGRPAPLISSACPAVIKLVQLRFPSLIPSLAPVLPPMEIAARLVKERVYPDEKDLGVFFITPCAGKVTVTRSPLGYGQSALDGVIGFKDIYIQMRNALSALPDQVSHRARAKGKGIAWARIDGESESLGERKAISVDGIANVINVFEALENGELRGISYVEALACPAGCVGGLLTVENPYVAKTRLRNLEDIAGALTAPPLYEAIEQLGWTEKLPSRKALVLDPDRLKALLMMEEMELLASGFPGLDCGSCGAPNCKALAEDIVRGKANAADCPFKLRENIRKLRQEFLEFEEWPETAAPGKSP